MNRSSLNAFTLVEIPEKLGFNGLWLGEDGFQTWDQLEAFHKSRLRH